MMELMKWVAWTAVLALPVMTLYNSTFVGNREFGRTSTKMVFFLWLDFLKDPSHSRLPYANLGCYFLAREITRSKRDDIIPLSDGEVFHGGNKEIYL